MSQREEYGGRLDEAYWEVNAAASRLISYGCGVSAKYLSDRRARMQFNRELAYYARRVMDDVYERRISPEQGLERILAEKKSLYSQASRILTQLGGMAGGASQLATGLGSCIGSLGSTCAIHGAPLIMHGGNNLYENAQGLYEGRTDVVGPVREFYQDAAKSLGYSERDGNLAYYTADLFLSGRAMWRKVPRRDAWRLYRYMDADKERKIKQLGKGGLAVELSTSGLTIKQWVDEYTK
ncbi:DUF4225 domain-containing protein [Pseudomonas sp. MWU13-3659]|uniref:DUF4225 domain-containing protein n=1 Tax=Pseudomonas sp. MWU13-3659 TaxID=2986964 RepID=UPI0020755C53|nr:DUF4225 domain-containing protein [Pseudomonas sp. MWU13-3659]